MSVANEYGKMMKDERAVWYLREHCECFCERDAINVLGTLA
jgi:hypothetical protein